MKYVMKKNILAMILVISMVLGTIVPKLGQAGVGALVAVPTVITIGAITGGAGVASVVGGIIYRQRNSQPMDGLGAMFLGAMVIVIGLIILDDQSHGMEFTALDETKAAQLEITTEQAEAYNFELDEINAAKQSIESEVTKMKKPSVEQVHALWQDMSANISPEAYSALEKVSAAFVANLKATK